VEARAVEQTQVLLEAGQAREAQAASVAGGVWSDKALALDRAIASAEAEAVRLREGVLALQAAVLSATFAAIDVPPPLASMRVLAGQASRGEALGVPDDVAAGDRERVRAKIRAEHLEELLAEGWGPPAESEDAGEEPADGDPSEGDGEGEPVDAEGGDDGEDGEEELPDDLERDSAGNLWRKAYVDRDGVHVAREAIVTQTARPPREAPSVGRRGRYDFSHPGLGR
jgi:hypothetical protein